MRTLAAITWLYAASSALTLHTFALRLIGITAETPLWRRLNAAVTYADANPYLPSRYRDPRDVADDAA